MAEDPQGNCWQFVSRALVQQVKVSRSQKVNRNFKFSSSAGRLHHNLFIPTGITRPRGKTKYVFPKHYVQTGSSPLRSKGHRKFQIHFTDLWLDQLVEKPQ